MENHVLRERHGCVNNDIKGKIKKNKTNVKNAIDSYKNGIKIFNNNLIDKSINVNCEKLEHDQSSSIDEENNIESDDESCID